MIRRILSANTLKRKMFNIHSQEPDARRRASWYTFCGTAADMEKTWRCILRQRAYPVFGGVFIFQTGRGQEEAHMFKINENYLKLPGSYLFSAIAKKVAAYEEANPDRQVIRLGIGDVTRQDISRLCAGFGLCLFTGDHCGKGLQVMGLPCGGRRDICIGRSQKRLRQYPGDIQRGQPHCGVRPCVSRVCGFQCHGGPYRQL